MPPSLFYSAARHKWRNVNNRKESYKGRVRFFYHWGRRVPCAPWLHNAPSPGSVAAAAGRGRPALGAGRGRASPGVGGGGEGGEPTPAAAKDWGRTQPSLLWAAGGPYGFSDTMAGVPTHPFSRLTPLLFLT